MLKRDQKLEQIEAVRAVADRALSVVVFRYSGLSVKDMNELREQARQLGVHVQVVKNTFARIAVGETPFGCVAEVLKGPVMLAFSLEEISASAKLIKKFMKDHECVQVEGLAIGEELLGPESLAAIAKLPTREEALAMLARTLLAPVSAMARCKQDVVGRLVRATSQVAAQS